MDPVRVLSFLGAVARPHYQAVAGALGLAAAVEEPGLERLHEVLAGGRPAVLFLCGLPYVRLRDEGVPVEPLAAPVPEGEPEARYFADLVVRPGLEASRAEQLGGARLAYNGQDSLSGWVLPRAALAARGLVPDLYGRALRSGSHRRSLELVAAGEADGAAVDSTVLALEARGEPAFAALRVVERLGPAPSPPVVLAHGTPEQAAELRAALLGLDRSQPGRAALAEGLVERYVPRTDADYDPVRALVRAAAG